MEYPPLYTVLYMNAWRLSLCTFFWTAPMTRQAVITVMCYRSHTRSFITSAFTLLLLHWIYPQWLMLSK